MNMTQEHLGALLNVSTQQIQRYETGANQIAAGRLPDIAKLLKVHIAYFFQELAPVKKHFPLPVAVLPCLTIAERHQLSKTVAKLPPSRQRTIVDLVEALSNDN